MAVQFCHLPPVIWRIMMVKLQTKPRNLFLLDAIHRKAGKHRKSNKAKRKADKQKHLTEGWDF